MTPPNAPDPAADIDEIEVPKKPHSLLRQVLPWVLGVGILGALFTQVPVADAWEAARSANLVLLIAASAGAVTFWFVVDAGAMSYLFSRFHGAFSRKEARSLRGSTYLVTPINWNVGTAAIILYLRQSKGISALEATSSMLFYGAIDGLVMTGLTFVGLTFLPSSPAIEQFQRIAGWATLGQIAFLTLLLSSKPTWSWLARLRSQAIFRTHSQATWREVSSLAAIRTVYFSVFALYFWAGAQAFHVELPLAVSTATMAVILMAQGLPITPAGLGTMQAAMLYFWKPYGPEAGILAFALAFPVCVTLSRMALGLIYVKDIRTRLATPQQ